MDKKFLHPILGRSESEQGEAEGRGPAPAEPQNRVGGRDRGACHLRQHMEPFQLHIPEPFGNVSAEARSPHWLC